jgi:hypothetical protein
MKFTVASCLHGFLDPFLVTKSGEQSQLSRSEHIQATHEEIYVCVCVFLRGLLTTKGNQKMTPTII